MLAPKNSITVFITSKRAAVRAVGRSACQVALPAASAVMLTAAFPPLDLWWLVWVALVPLALSVCLSRRLAEPLVGALVGGAVLHLVALDWIRTCYDGQGLSGPGASAWLAAALVPAPTWCITVAVAHLLYWRFSTTMAVAFALAWLAGDVARRAIALVSTGMDFPWLQLPAPLTAWPVLVQVADVGGTIGTSAIVAFVNGCVCDMIAARTSRARCWAGLAAAGTVALLVGYGAWRLGTAELAPGPTIALMPTESASAVFGTEPLAPPKADLLLWPEGTLQDNNTSDTDYRDKLEALAKAARTLVAMGWYRTRPTFKSNSLAIVHPRDGLVGLHEKTYLVPWFESAANGGDGQPHGAPRGPFATFDCNGAQVAPAICYDACFAGLYQRFEVPDVFVVASAESADQTSRMAEHILQMVRLRAIEFRRPIVRNVDGGHSGIIDSCGRLRVDIFDLRDPLTVGPVPLDKRATIYATFGDAPLATSIIALGAVWLYRRRRQGNRASGDASERSA